MSAALKKGRPPGPTPERVAFAKSVADAKAQGESIAAISQRTGIKQNTIRAALRVVPVGARAPAPEVPESEQAGVILPKLRRNRDTVTTGLLRRHNIAKDLDGPTIAVFVHVVERFELLGDGLCLDLRACEGQLFSHLHSLAGDLGMQPDAVRKHIATTVAARLLVELEPDVVTLPPEYWQSSWQRSARQVLPAAPRTPTVQLSFFFLILTGRGQGTENASDSDFSSRESVTENGAGDAIIHEMDNRTSSSSTLSESVSAPARVTENADGTENTAPGVTENGTEIPGATENANGTENAPLAPIVLEPVWASLASSANEACGRPATLTAADRATVAGWRDRGVTPEFVRPVIDAVLGRPNRPAINALSYFDKPLDQAIAAAKALAETAAEAAQAPQPAADAREMLWKEGIPKLRGLAGWSDGRARSFLGKLLKETRDNCVRALNLINEAVDTRPVDPEAWLMKAAREGGGGPKGRSNPEGRMDYIVEFFQQQSADTAEDLFQGKTVDGRAS